jgi:hypothetical protein
MSQAFERIEFLIRGVTQHVQHNGQLADQSNPFVIAMKEITSKTARNKTEADFKRLEALEWEGSLYVDHERRVIVPGTTIEGAYFEAAQKKRKGPNARNGIVSPGDWPLIYDGPKSLEKLKEDMRFRFSTIVKNPATKGRVKRTRPIFRQWELRYILDFRTSMFDRKEIITMTELLGTDIGLSDDRKKMGGRFEIVEVKTEKP